MNADVGVEGKKPKIVKALNIILLILFLALCKGWNLLLKRPFDETEIWYCSLRGESIFLSISIVIGIILFVLFGLSLKKDCRSKILNSKLLLIFQFCAVFVIIVCITTLPQYYDAIYINEDGTYSFTASRVLQKPKNYSMRDVVLCQMDSISDIWMEMADGERVYIEFGITTASDSFDAIYSIGEVACDIHDQLKKSSVSLTIKDRDKILKTINKYQQRSNLKLWQEYLPQIVSNIP